MKAKHVTEADMTAALNKVNEKYDGNIVFKRFDRNGNGFNFTLTVASSKAPGHRRGFQRDFSKPAKRLSAACWHVHGDYFDALFAVAPNAIITSANKKITREAGNWQDWNIGSQKSPLLYSGACDCND